jgi:L-fuconolactonase
MRIDAHHHVWDLKVRPQPWTDPFPVLARAYSYEHDLRPELTACDISATIVVQTVTVPEETPELLALAQHDPKVVGVVGWVDLTAPDVAAQLRGLRTGRGGRFLVGIRHQVQDELGCGWFELPAVAEGLRVLAAHNLNYDLIVRPDQLKGATALAGAMPELRFVLDHGGNPDIAGGEFAAWSQDLTVLAALPNVAVKLSGLVTRASEEWSVEQLKPYAEHLLDAFSPARVLFGSDWPVCLLRCGYAQVVETTEALTSGLSTEERAAVFGGSATTWYRLELAG